VKISIFGCCATRDIFTFAGVDDWVTQSQYYARSSVVSAVSAPVVFNRENFEMFVGEKSTFDIRCVLYDLEKLFYKSHWLNADYLIVDFWNEGFDIGSIRGASNQLVTISDYFDNYALEKIFDLRVLTQDEKEVLLHNSIKKFVDLIRPMLLDRKVILHEVYYTDKYYISTGCYEYFDKKFIDPRNRIYEICNSVFKTLCGDALKVVSLLNDESHVGDPNHKWGLGGVHYVKEYYSKAFEMMEFESNKFI
jgi:hypothetical protein